MGGCHSYPSETETDVKTLQTSDVSDDKLGINNNVEEERLYLQEHKVRITHTDMVPLTALPVGVDHAEWLATNTVSFFNHINLLSSVMSEFCTPSSCPSACGPGNTVYLWTDDHGRKLKCSAPLYFDYVTSYIQDLLTDEDVFPTRAGVDFPSGFFFLIQKVFLLLFGTLCHMMWSHYGDAVMMELHPHLNTLFIHLTHFCHTHALLEEQHTHTIKELIKDLTWS